MSDLNISLAPPSAEGRLHARYDEDAGILEVSSRVPRSWPYGVDLDGNVVFDIDEQRRLANMDLLIPKKKWEFGLNKPDVTKAVVADLLFREDTIFGKSFRIPLRIISGDQQKWVHIQIGTKQWDKVVELSSSCFALTSGHILSGFMIEFA